MVRHARQRPPAGFRPACCYRDGKAARGARRMRSGDAMTTERRIGFAVKVLGRGGHRLNHGGMTAEEAARAALDTWPADVTPKVHFSSPRLDGRVVGRGREARLQAPLLRQHADYIDPWTFADLLQGIHDRRFDVMLEAKAKDLALLKLRADLRMLG